MRSPAPRWRAENRAEGNRNDASLIKAHPEPEGDFAALFVARRYGFALPLARAIVALARIGGAFA
jgi:hypothetical protein